MLAMAVRLPRGIGERFEHQVVDVTITPLLARLLRANDGVTCGVVMLGRVLVLRRVAAPHVATGHAEPEVNPAITDAQAIFATGRTRLDGANLIEVRTIYAAKLPAPGRVANRCFNILDFALCYLRLTFARRNMTANRSCLPVEAPQKSASPKKLLPRVGPVRRATRWGPPRSG